MSVGDALPGVHGLPTNEPVVSNVAQLFILNLPTSPRILEMLLKLPTEVLESIILECAVVHPSLLACLAQTCRALRALISHPTDQHLWRTIFLSIFDDPRCILSMGRGISQELVSFDWQRESQRRCRAQLRMDRAAVTEMEDFDEVVDEDVADTLFDVAMSTLPATSDATSLNAEWLAERMRAALLPSATTQHRAKLYILASLLPVRTSASLPPVTFRSADSRLPSRAFVYDMRNYVEETKWGPWLSGEDGSVNWIHLWHLIDVLRHNAHERVSDDIPNTSIEHLRAHSAPKSEDEPENQWNDWAGVQGIWLRAVSFMDYRDLHAYNFSSTSNGAYSTAIFENANFAEAFRLIKSYFTITKIDEVGPPEYPHRPTIYFVGDTALPNHPTDLGTHRITRGSVCMTKSGNIRWTFITRVGGHSWASEGVQLGNVQSRAGVVGVWSSADHEDGDPAGPFWLWKSSEDKLIDDWHDSDDTSSDGSYVD